MNQFIRFRLAPLALAFLLPLAALASQHFETDDFNFVAVSAEMLAQKYGVEDVLVVYDIDNTLLAPNQDLGTDQWFAWQEKKIKSGDFDGAVAHDMNGLFEAVGVLYSLGHMHAPHRDTARVVQSLGRAGFASVILTSRGYSYRDATLRELGRNGLRIDAYAFGPRGGFLGTFLPYDISHPEAAGLNSAEVANFGLGPARPVIFQNGVFMGDGQHKGAMLRSLLAKTGEWFKAIVFVDDTAKHSERMQAAFAPKGVDVITIRYSAEDANVERFNRSDKSAVIAAWEKLKATLSEVFR